MNPRIAELESLRSSALLCVEKVAKTLLWFSEQFEARNAIPRNTWANLDRPLPRERGTLGLAFDVWHAMFRSEGALRNTNKKLAKTLDERCKKHKSTLQDLLRKMVSNKGNMEDDIVALLTADEIHGTFNSFSAASILRSEVFPDRSAVTPSYLAGHILVAELRVAQRKAASRNAEGIKERPPRIAAIAEGVHSLMLYVEHLRKRAEEFTRIAGQLGKVEKLNSGRAQVKGLPPDKSADVEDAYVRVALAIISPSCERSGQLLLSLREFFRALDARCSELLDTDSLTTTSLETAFAQAANQSRDHKRHPDDPEQTQSNSYTFAFDYARDLYANIDQIKRSLKSIFSGSNYADVQEELRKLAISGRELIRKHLGSLDFTNAPPSIVDSARFGFVEDLINSFSEVPFRNWLREGKRGPTEGERQRSSPFTSESHGPRFLGEGNRDLINHLKDFCNRYGIKNLQSDDPCHILKEIGKAPIGRSVLRWWENYADSYRAPKTAQAATGTELGTSDHWLSLRHRSFIATQRVRSGLEKSTKLSDFKTTLEEGAKEYKALAEEVHDMLKGLTQWCQTHGRDLLLGAKISSEPIDPNELISALWIADRLEEPWPTRFELEALRVVEGLQRQNGGFDPAEPLWQNRGFLFYASSARTLTSLARFVMSSGELENRSPELRERAKRWQKALAAGTRFLANELVEGRFAGWRSDRHPETGRIDCSVTTEAITALCRSIDVYSSLINIEGTEGFNVRWPTDRMSKAFPADCEAKSCQILPTLMNIMRDLRRRTGRYSAPWQTPPMPGATMRSLLFYGPPGTGKTYFQNLIAGELGWPLVTLSIGDFLADGEDKVGARTVQIFDQLRHLSNACIVFDEFDEMVVRRSSKEGHSSFNLLTPTLLPLLAELRKHAESYNCLVTFTTNYIERLDRAAKRVGRVDRQFPLIYHDFTSRLLICLGMATDPNVVGHSKKLHWTALEKDLLSAGLCAYPEMVSFIENVISGQGGGQPELPRQAIDCEFYMERLRGSSPDRQVIEEATLVVESYHKTEMMREWASLYAKLDIKQLPRHAKSAAANK